MKPITLVLMGLAGLLSSATLGFGQTAENLSGAEQQAMADTVQYALENNRSNQPSDWVNPDTGNSGGIVPVRTFTDSQGGPCREFVTTIVIGGEQQQGYGTACRQPDGTWELVPTATESTQPPPAVVQAPVYINHPPPYYYYYPADFYYPYRIYLSFGYVYRSGHAFRGVHFLDGPSFRHRHPIHIHHRVYVSPRDLGHRHWFDHRHRDRNVERRTIHRTQDRRVDREWRDRDRSNDRRVDRNRGRGGDDRRGRGGDDRRGRER